MKILSKCRNFKLIILSLLLCTTLVVIWNGWIYSSLTTPQHSVFRLSPEEIAYLTDKCDKKFSNDLNYHVNDLIRLKTSVLKELQSLEDKRNILLAEIQHLISRHENMQQTLRNNVKELDSIRNSIAQAKLAQKESMERDIPSLRLPHRTLLNSKLESSFSLISNSSWRYCTLNSCFDHSKCPIHECQHFNWVGFIRPKEKFVCDLPEPCLTFLNSSSLPSTGFHLQNTVIIDHFGSKFRKSSIFETKAIVASATFSMADFRHAFDFVIPALNFFPTDDSYWQNIALISPARRKYLFSFVRFENEPSTEDFIENYLASIVKSSTSTRDAFYLDQNCADSILNCRHVTGTCNGVLIDKIYNESTFSLILTHENYASTFESQVRVIKALKFGAVPVILGDLVLPFSDFIDWRKCSLVLPKSRVTELHFRLR